jgi:exopolysaccharide biosynthesis polyprenyl glycosylphosphotransferase
VAFGRLVIRRVRTKQTPRVLILGSGPMAQTLVDEIESAAVPRFIVAGLVDDDEPEAGTPVAQRWLGTAAQLAEIVEREEPDSIVVAVENRRERLPLQALLESRVRGIVVEDALDFYERLTGKMAIEALRPSVLILSKGFRNRGADEVSARVVSVVAAVIGLVLTAPLLALIALLVKLDSRGPVMFVQERSGKNGRPFGLLKFRTMHPSATTASEWVRDNTHRITRLGHWLRRFRLDELPQLLNVLRGEMDLVGPRPHPVRNQQTFMEGIAYYGLRSTVRPGVTGWAQIRYGYANNLEEETEKMRFDLYYIKNRSLWLDIRILFETVGIMVFGQGATEVRHQPPIDRTRVTLMPMRRRANDARFLPWIPGAPMAPRQSAGQH